MASQRPLIETERDPLAGATHFVKRVSVKLRQLRLHRAQQKRSRYSDLAEAVPRDARSQRFYIQLDIGQFGHGRGARAVSWLRPGLSAWS